MAASLVSLSALPGFAFQSLGFRLVRFANPAAEADDQSESRPVQFSLRQIFVLTLVIAIIVALTANLFVDESEKLAAARLVGLLALLGLSAASVAITALAVRFPFRRSVMVAVGYGAITFLLVAPFVNSISLSLGVSGWSTMNALFSGGALLLYRRLGFRIVRPPPTECALPEKPHG
jgi:Ca2+/H+ antiporter